MNIIREPNPEYFREWQYSQYLSALDDDDDQQHSVRLCALCGEETVDEPITLCEKNLKQIYCCAQCFAQRGDEDNLQNLSK